MSAASAGPYRWTLSLAALTCAVMPWYTVRWHYGPLPTTLLETGILVTVAAFAVESWRSGLVPEWRTGYTIPAALFIIAGAISVLDAPSHRAALGLYRADILEPIAFFVVIASVVRSWNQARWILAGLAVAGVTVSIPNTFVILQLIRHHTLNVAIAPPVVIYQTLNALALFIVPLIAVAAALLLYAPDRRDRVASAVFIVITVPAALLSFSRGGYVALVVIGVLLALTHRWRIWFLGLIALLAVLASRIPPVANRISHEVDFSDPNNSLLERARLWGATLKMLRDHPILGTGISGFKQTIAGYRNGYFGAYPEDLIYPHNILLNFWTETGLLGLAAFIWIFVQAVRVTWRGWRFASASWRPLHLGVLLMLVGVVIHGLVDVPYWKNDLSLEFWVLLGLSWAGQRWAPVAKN